MDVKKISDYKYLIQKHGDMKVDAVIFADETILPKVIEDKSFEQLINVASLPGIVGKAVAMPDIHWGYGFPVGGVAAFDFHEGIVSPGGVGFDINCGVRLHTTSLTLKDVRNKIEDIVNTMFEMIPAGVGLSGHIKLSKNEMKRISEEGARFAVSYLSLGTERELESIESFGTIQGADFSTVSDKAYERGRDQLGTIGSGNHFVEVGYVEQVLREDIAKSWGIYQGQITVLIHSGSRGFGHQICEDYVRVALRWCERNKMSLKDNQLAFMSVSSKEGQNYLSAMRSAINYAFSNRLIIAHYCKEALKKSLGITEKDLNWSLLYDVAHNTAKIETHRVDGKEMKLIVHRKGATRAFPKGHPELPEKYRGTGQPVIIPGDMGRYSYVLVASDKAMEESFGSTCHGAGRNMSRSKALKIAKGRDIAQELKKKGIVVRAREKHLLAEEMSEAYKDVYDVVRVCEKAELSLIVAKLVPLGVIKG